MPLSIENGLLQKVTNVGTLDYTKLDFTSIKAAIIQFIRDNYPDVQNDFFQSNAAVMLIDALSYTNDILAYRADFLANEAYLPTASTQKSILNLLQLINYTPRGPSAALGDVTITLIDADPLIIDSNGLLTEDILISDGTTKPRIITAQDVAGNNISFEIVKSATTTEEQVIFPSQLKLGTGSIDATIVEGVTVSQLVNTPSTVPENYYIRLSYASVLENSISVRVNGIEWARTQNFAYENGPTTSYEVRYTQTNTYNVVFGDGIFGAKPPVNSIIEVKYRTGGGTFGNLAIGSVNTTFSAASSVSGRSATFQIINTSATTGGSARENLEFSKFYAPRQFATQLRAVTGQDYATLGLGYKDGTNGSISKCVSALRPYLALYGSAVGLYNITAGVNNTITIKTKTATRNVQLDEGSNLTLQNVIDNFNAKALDLFPTENDVEFYAFSYPSSSYRIRGTVAKNSSTATVSIDSSNRNLRINCHGIPYNVLLTIGDRTYSQIVSDINSAINTGANTNFAQFIAEAVLFNNNYYVEIHLTSQFIPSDTDKFCLEGPANNANSTLGFTTSTNASVLYSTQKFAVGLKYHTPDSYFELLSTTASAYTLLGLQAMRAYPMAANYVDMYVLADGILGVPTVASDSLKSALSNFISRYKVLTDKVTIWDGSIKYLQLEVKISVNKSYVLEEIKTVVQNALGTTLTAGTNSFGDTFYVSKIYDTIDDISGIDYIDIVDLKEDAVSQLTTGSGQFRNISTNFSEMWLFDNIIVNAEYTPE